MNGIELLPSWPAFASFALAGLLLNLVPGQDMLFVIVNSARSGKRAGIVAAFGIGAGAIFHIAAAAVGVSALIAASAEAFTILKVVGVGYLLWLALSMLRSGKHSTGVDLPQSQNEWQIFRRAALVNITNPKVALFFLAFLPQFVSARARIPAVEILCLGLWFDGVGTLVNVLAALIADAASKRVAQLERMRRASRWLAASVLALLAARLAFAERP